MKAVLCKEFGPPEGLVVEEMPSPTAGRGQVVVEVRACGVNFPDILLIQNKYQFKPPLPFAPGGEVAGVVTEVGEGVRNVRIGDRVIGSTGWGGFAERAKPLGINRADSPGAVNPGQRAVGHEAERRVVAPHHEGVRLVGEHLGEQAEPCGAPSLED